MKLVTKATLILLGAYGSTQSAANNQKNVKNRIEQARIKKAEEELKKIEAKTKSGDFSPATLAEELLNTIQAKNIKSAEKYYNEYDPGRYTVDVIQKAIAYLPTAIENENERTALKNLLESIATQEELHASNLNKRYFENPSIHQQQKLDHEIQNFTDAIKNYGLKNAHDIQDSFAFEDFRPFLAFEGWFTHKVKIKGKANKLKEEMYYLALKGKFKAAAKKLALIYSIMPKSPGAHSYEGWLNHGNPYIMNGLLGVANTLIILEQFKDNHNKSVVDYLRGIPNGLKLINTVNRFIKASGYDGVNSSHRTFRIWDNMIMKNVKQK